MYVIEEQLDKLSTASLESEMIVNSVQERRSATIKLVMVVRSSAMLASKALTERTKEESKAPIREKHAALMVQRLEDGILLGLAIPQGGKVRRYKEAWGRMPLEKLGVEEV